MDGERNRPEVSLHTAQLIDTLTMGGAEKLAVQFANGFSAAGHVSHLYVLTTQGPLSPIIKPGVKVRYLCYKRLSIKNPIAFFLSVLKGLRLISQYLKTDGIQVLQTHLPDQNFWGLLLSWLRRCAVVATVHNNAEFFYGDTDHPFRAGLRRWAYGKILTTCRATVAVSRQVRGSLLEELGLGETEVRRFLAIDNGVPIPDPLSEAQRNEVRRRHGIPPQSPLILAAGRLHEQKNFKDLLSAAAILKERGMVFKLLIAGEGELRRDMETQIDASDLADMASMPGNLNDLMEVMASADIFAIPSLWEGLPLVLLEAMACALPVVGTKIKGIADVVQEGRNGLLIEPGDVKGLADALQNLISHPEIRHALGGRGRSLVKERFDFRRVITELERLYMDVLKRE